MAGVVATGITVFAMSRPNGKRRSSGPIWWSLVSTNDGYRSSDGRSASTLAQSEPSSPRQPPQYQEEVPIDAKSKAKARKTLLISLLTSIFITVLVILIVAATVGRIHNSQSNTRNDNKQNQSTATQSIERFTLMSGEATPVSPDTEETSSNGRTRGY